MVVEVLDLQAAQLAAPKSRIQRDKEHDAKTTLGVLLRIQRIEERLHVLRRGNVYALAGHDALYVLHGRILKDSLVNEKLAEDFQHLNPCESAPLLFGLRYEREYCCSGF